MECLRTLVKACVLLDWFYIDDDMFLIWIYTPKNMDQPKTAEEFLKAIDQDKEEVWLMKIYGKPKKEVFKALSDKFKKENIKVVKWINTKMEVKQWVL